MSAPDYILVQFDDWQALYCNGDKVLEGHRLSTRDVLAEMEVPCEFRSVTPEYDAQVAETGIVPDHPSEYPPDAFE